MDLIKPLCPLKTDETGGNEKQKLTHTVAVSLSLSHTLTNKHIPNQDLKCSRDLPPEINFKPFII